MRLLLTRRRRFAVEPIFFKANTVRRLSWRGEADDLKAGSPEFERRNPYLSSGVAV
jgi:hypothetical protein